MNRVQSLFHINFEIHVSILASEPNSGIRAILIRVRTYAIKCIVACFSIMLGFIDPDIY